MDASPKHDRALIAAASAHARDAQDYAQDISAILFPRSIVSPSEEMVSALRTKMLALVSGIEAALTGQTVQPTGQLPQSWPMLSRSGFLGEADLVDFMLARVAEDRIEKCLATGEYETPASLLVALAGSEDAQIADAAKSLLAADSLHRHARGHSHHGLKPEILHRLCWRVVAALEVASGVREASAVENARVLLDQYDEAKTAEASARRLMHLLGPAGGNFLAVEQAGLHLFIASMASTLGMEPDHILRLIDGASAAPLTMMLRARGVSPDAALALIYQMKGFSLTPQDIHLFENGYSLLDRDEALAEIRQWSSERAHAMLKPEGSKA